MPARNKPKSPTRKKVAKATRAPRRGKAVIGIQGIISREVDALLAEKASLDSRLAEIKNRLAGLQVARDVFEGKPYSVPVDTPLKPMHPSQLKRAAKSANGRAARGRVSSEVLQAISSGKATTRAALIKKFGYESDVRGQYSISNALSQLKTKKLIKPGNARGEWRAT